MYGIPRATLITQIAYRLNDPRTGTAVRWTDADIDNAITDALLIVEPLGDEIVLTMSAATYAVSPQLPTAAVLGIKRLECDAGNGQWATVERGGYLLQHQASQWLQLRNAPAAGETFRISAVTQYDRSPAALITADAELITLYVLAMLYERVSTFGGIGSRQDDAAYAVSYRTSADLRKQALVFQLYPVVTTAAPQGGKKS